MYNVICLQVTQLTGFSVITDHYICYTCVQCNLFIGDPTDRVFSDNWSLYLLHKFMYNVIYL